MIKPHKPVKSVTLSNLLASSKLPCASSTPPAATRSYLQRIQEAAMPVTRPKKSTGVAGSKIPKPAKVGSENQVRAADPRRLTRLPRVVLCCVVLCIVVTCCVVLCCVVRAAGRRAPGEEVVLPASWSPEEAHGLHRHHECKSRC